MTAQPALSVDALDVRIDGTPILSGVDLRVEEGEVVALLGPSGSGKTTLLSAIAGFVDIASGEVRVGAALVAGKGTWEPPERRAVAFVFQSYALWPHMSALDTVAFPLLTQGTPRDEARAQAGVILEALGIAGLAERRPSELSGGQQQRVGLARALARQASLYLLDEPTAHLDAATRAEAEALIAAQREAAGAAALYATHDPAEALAIADRVALLRDGFIVQVGTPEDVYEQPVDAWAARLTGPASIVDAGPAVSTEPPEGRLLVRPEWVQLEGDGAPATVTAVRFRGSHTDLTLDTPQGEIEARVPGRSDHRPGDQATWSLSRVWRLP